MGQGESNIRHGAESRLTDVRTNTASNEDFVLEKSIFNNVFEKDIRRVFIYKKAERLAKAIHLIAPAFVESLSLRNRIDAIALGLVDAAILPSSTARMKISRELLALSSVLAIARTSGFLSLMNVELIAHEARVLLQEVAAYEEPLILLDEVPTLSALAKQVPAQRDRISVIRQPQSSINHSTSHKGHIKDIKSLLDNNIKDRREAVLSVIRDKKTASIKDISMLIRGVSEKTIQRELLALISSGLVEKKGERRWSTYSLR